MKKVKAEIQLDIMQIIGDYILSQLWSKTSGPYNVTLTNVVAKGNASVAGIFKTFRQHIEQFRKSNSCASGTADADIWNIEPAYILHILLNK